ncbi:MAG TPA: hypothetical protein VGP08_18295 [Pyrinomonadaceae bacterium]|nr:hypothetical protein [Pyrinomonadaceae bacterium]
MKSETQRHLKRVILSSLLLLASMCAAARAEGEGERKTRTRTISGMVYYTNDTPDVYDFPVELFDSKFRRIAATRTPRDGGYFEFKGLRPAKYYFQVLISSRCLLQYEVDARKAQPERKTILADADCGGPHQIVGMPAPRPVPRKKKR